MPDRLGYFHRHRFPAEVISYAVGVRIASVLEGEEHKLIPMVEKWLEKHGPNE